MPVCPLLPISAASGVKKTPRFNTVKQSTAAGLTSAIALMPFPAWDFEISMDNIKGRESFDVVSKFLGIYMATCAGANTFLFSDPQDNAVTGAQFGTGNGTAVAFQLSRNIYGMPDIIQNLNGTPKIYVNGTLTTPSSISTTGVVTFSSAPANNAVLTWAGQFYFCVRFTEDTLDATRAFSINNGIDLWNIQGIKFASEFRTTTTYGLIASPGGV